MNAEETKVTLFDLTAVEVRALSAAISAMPRDEVKGEGVWLNVSESTRKWRIASKWGAFEMDIVDQHGADTPGWVMVSDRVIRFAESLYLFDTPSVPFELICLPEGPTAVVVGNQPMTAVIDLPFQREDMPREYEWSTDAEALVSGRVFTQLLSAARQMPSGAGGLEWLSPPMWLGVSEAGLGLHVDWSDVLPSRSTYRMSEGSFKGSATVAIPHVVMNTFLEAMYLEEDDIAMHLGDVLDVRGERMAVHVSNGEWSLVCFEADPMADRWGDRINEMMATEGWIPDRGTNLWQIPLPGASVQLTLHHGHPDVARVSAVVCDKIASSPEMLHELNALNVANTGVRLFHADNMVRAVADVRLTEFDGLAAAIREVGKQAARYGDLVAALGAPPPPPAPPRKPRAKRVPKPD